MYWDTLRQTTSVLQSFSRTVHCSTTSTATRWRVAVQLYVPERPVSASRGGGSWNLASSVAIDRQRLAMGGSAAENATYRMASIEAGFERAAVQPAASVAAWVAVEGAGAHRRGQQLYGRLALSRRSARRERGREGGRTRREKAGVDRAVEVSLSLSVSVCLSVSLSLARPAWWRAVCV